MSKSFNENSRVKIPALLHLTRLNYKYISLKKVENQIDTDTNIFKKSFQNALNKINSKNFSDEDINSIIDELKMILDADDLGSQFYEKFFSGISLHDETFRLIDFENIENNIFEFMTEVPYKSVTESFRPDITIFINGLPLAFVEVKIPDNKEGLQAEFNRMHERFSQKIFRRFVNITQLMIFSNNSDYDDEEITPLEGAFYATSDYKKLSFNRFREDDKNFYEKLFPLDEETETEILRDTNYLSIRATNEYELNKEPSTPTNKILTSIFSRERFMFILHYGFAYFRESKDSIATLQKHILRYQQMFALFAMKKMLDDGLKHGTIWHTQGSGKTALAYYGVKFLSDYFQRKNFSTQFYFIVDRIDLLTQAADEFKKRGLEVNTISSRENFIESIQRVGSSTASGKLSINVVNIHKFSEESVATEPKFNVDVQRIYFIDEAHRDYKWDGSFLARLMTSDRNAVMLALTGTPLLGEHKTRDIFGKYIHTYYYNQSIADGYTLRLIREGIKTEYRLLLQTTLKNLESQVVKGAIKKTEIYSHKNFVEPLVEYIEKDFAATRERLNKKIGAMIACESAEQAQAVCAEIQRRKKFSAELVLSTVGYSHDELKDKRKKFLNNEVDILVVFQMLLTGFDAPRLKKLYLGREIKAHNLLQALTRVNRPYKNLRYGFVVDFADIQREFDKTNQAYLKELQEEFGDAFSSYQKIFKTQKEIVTDLDFVREKLFQFDTHNAENFRLQIQAVEDKKILFELRKAIELYKEDFNLAEIYGYADLKGDFDLKKNSDLSNVVNNRLQILRTKDLLNDAEDITQILNIALDDIEFSFKKTSQNEMTIGDKFLILRKKTCREFQINADKKDPEYVKLIDELKRILQKYNIEEMTAAQIQIQQAELETLLKKIRAVNEENNRLIEKYDGDPKFMRVHKIFRKNPEFNNSQLKVYQVLAAIKNSLDDQLADNYFILDNEGYFIRMTQHFSKKSLFDSLDSMKDPLDLIKKIAADVAQEYFDERRDFD